MSFTISWNLLRFMSTESVMLSNISSCAALFSFCLQSFPASGSFLMSRLFTSGDQSIGGSSSSRGSLVPLHFLPLECIICLSEIVDISPGSLDYSFCFSVSPSNEYSGLISLKFDWFDLRAVQGAHKTLVQHQSSKASILQYSAFMVQLSHTYMTTRKTVALTRQPFVVK